MGRKAVVAVIAVSLAAVLCFVIVTSIDGPDECPGIVYHGNGGTSDGSYSVCVTSEGISPCPFVNGDLHFYRWNTSPDASGEFYDPFDDNGYDKLVSEGVRDLYAVWVYQLNASFSGTSSGDSRIVTLLVNSGSVIDVQSVTAIPTYLDPSEKTARIGLAVTGPDGEQRKDVSWSFDRSTVTFTGVADGLSCSVTVTGGYGVSGILPLQPDDGIVAFDFNYSGDVSFAFSTTMTADAA